MLVLSRTAAENEKDDVNRGRSESRDDVMQAQRSINRRISSSSRYHSNMSENIPDDIGKRGLQRLTLFEPDSPKSVCTTLPEPSIGVIACDRIASSTQGVFHYVPDPPEDSIGVRALSKLVPKDQMPELRSTENVSEK